MLPPVWQPVHLQYLIKRKKARSTFTYVSLIATSSSSANSSVVASIKSCCSALASIQADTFETVCQAFSKTVEGKIGNIHHQSVCWIY